ncbi:hypothetical protein B0919_14055 [Hymenobacter sp. CRA2]|nr:hypothetical protein B0919_14055 [Hymenobacter sp. CRA2]
MLTGCGVTRQAYHGFRPAEARDMVCVRPVAVMALVVRGDEAPTDPWFSRYMADCLQRSLQRQAAQLKLGPAPADDSLRRDELRREVERAMAQLSRQPAEGFSAPLPVLESFAAQQAGRYALLTMCRGFMRTTDNNWQTANQYGHQRALYGPMLASAPQPSRLGLYALVYDRQEKRVVYYGHCAVKRDKLLKDKVIDQQVRRLLGTDFGS